MAIQTGMRLVNCSGSNLAKPTDLLKEKLMANYSATNWAKHLR